MANATMYKVPVKGGGHVEVEGVSQFPDNVYIAIVTAGLKDLLNRGMTKVGPLKVDAAKGHDEATVEASKAKAMEIATANLANLVQGKLPRMAGVKASDGKIPGVVMTEARRLARNVIKDEIKKAGEKISHYDAKDITAMANELLKDEAGKELLEQAKANVAARDSAPKPTTSIADLQAKLGISVNATKVAKAAEKKAAAKASSGGVLSAAKAGQLKQRSAQPKVNA